MGPKTRSQSAAGVHVTVESNSNPFGAENQRFFREQKGRSASYAAHHRSKAVPSSRGARRNSRPPNTSKLHFDNQAILQALEKLEDRDTVEHGRMQLKDVLSHVQGKDELIAFFRIAFNMRKPLISARARKEQLMLLPDVCCVPGDALMVFREHILPFLVTGLHNSDTQETIARVLVQIIEDLVPKGDTCRCHKSFMEVAPTALKSLLDPLVLGTGADALMKQRCVEVLGGVTPTLLKQAQRCADSVEVACIMKNYSTLLVQCLTANAGLHTGLLKCLIQVAAHDATHLVEHAHYLVKTCTEHLLLTPSLTPNSVVPQPLERSGAGNSKQHVLTRELAFVCCICLHYLAEKVAPLLCPDESLWVHWPHVAKALGRENLNLQRVVRANEQLRQAISRTLHTWESSNHVELGSQGDRTRKYQASSRQADPRDQWDNLVHPILEDPVPDTRPSRRCLSHGHARGGTPGHTVRPRSAQGRPRSAGVQLAAYEVRPTADDGVPSQEGEDSSSHPVVGDQNQTLKCPSDNELGRLYGPALQDQTPEHTADIQKDKIESLQEAQSHKVAAGPASKKEACTSGAGPLPRALMVVPSDNDLNPVCCESSDVKNSNHTIKLRECIGGAGALPSGACSAGPVPPKKDEQQEEVFKQRLPHQDMHRGTILSDNLASGCVTNERVSCAYAVAEYIKQEQWSWALQCIFQHGNERLLMNVLCQVDSCRVCQNLPLSESAYLGHLLTCLLCKDPFGDSATQALIWLRSLLSANEKAIVIPKDDLGGLRMVLFNIAGDSSDKARHATLLFHQLFQS